MPEANGLTAVLRTLLSWPSLIGGLIGLVLLYTWAILRSGADRERAFYRAQGLPDPEQPLCLRGQRVARRRPWRRSSPARRRIDALITRIEAERVQAEADRLKAALGGEDALLARRYRTHGEDEAA